MSTVTIMDTSTISTNPCGVCEGKRFIVVSHDDNKLAIERCDECSQHLSDNEVVAHCALTAPPFEPIEA
jgi:hypothetical protein